MNDIPNEPASASDRAALESKQVALIARRRLLRGGMGVAPVLMVSAPRSVMAGTLCVPASATASINMSRPDLQSNCIGRTPDVWMDPSKTPTWPTGCVRSGSSATMFNTVFGAGGGYDGKTLLAVLKFPDSSGKNYLARHIVAAWLNACSGMTPDNVLGKTVVKRVWSDFVATGTYQPTAGVFWSADTAASNGTGGITNWLKSTMSA